MYSAILICTNEHYLKIPNQVCYIVISSIMEIPGLEEERLEEKKSSDQFKSEQTLLVTKNENSAFKKCDSVECANVSINTIQNIYDEKIQITRSNSFQSKTFLQVKQLNTSVSTTVDRLEDTYENISKPTDNDLKANEITRPKANTDNISTDITENNTSTNKPKKVFRTELTTQLTVTSDNEIPSAKSKLIVLNSEAISERETPEQLLTKTQSNIEKLQNSLSTKLSNDTIAKLRSKYSPASYGYPKIPPKPLLLKKVQFLEYSSKIPVPTPRSSDKQSAKVELKPVIVEEVLVPESNSKKDIDVRDENSNVIQKNSTEKILTSILKRPQSETEIDANTEESKIKNTQSPNLNENIEFEIEHKTIEYAEPEDKHFIVRRSSSEDSVDQLESFMSEFIMDKKTKEKKRSNSFRKMLTRGLFGRDKKEPEDNRLKEQKKDSVVFSENAQNESQAFDRNSPRRHTVDLAVSRRVTKTPGVLHYNPQPTQFRRTEDGERYTQMGKTGSFVSNRPPKYSPEHYLPMDNGHPHQNNDFQDNVSKYIDTSSSSSNTIDYDRNSTYQNALIAQAEMRKLRENSKDRSLGQHSTSPNTSQNLQLVKPKALIPINSERPLPNPYQLKQDKINKDDTNELSQTLNRNLNFEHTKPYPQKSNLYTSSDGSKIIVEDVYGTVFDSVSPPNDLRLRCVSPSDQRGPLSPKSLERSKLKLPPNREKIDLQPRIRSPIPQTKVSTDKIIATELLRSKRSPSRSSINNNSSQDNSRYSSPTPTRPSSYQGANIYENTFDFSEKATRAIPGTPNNGYSNHPSTPATNSPQNRSASETHLLAAEWHRKQQDLNNKTPQITTDALVHVNPSDESLPLNYTTPPLVIGKNNAIYTSSPKSANSSINNLSLYGRQQQSSPSPSSRSDKQHMLQNVEAFYWRELRKLKDKEDQELLNYRRQQMQVYGYIEDPVLSRRSRSVSPGVQRGRRSLSLPRDARPVPNVMRPHTIAPEPIPEGRPVIAKKPIPLPTDGPYIRQPLQRNPNFIRNTFERSTIGPIGVNQGYAASEGGYKGSKQTTPIFKRGSLTVNENAQESPYSINKRVSFESHQNLKNPTSWPTKNGFTRSPPTRRIERELSLDDDVFLPNELIPNKCVEEIYVIRKQQMQPDRVVGHEVYNYPSEYGMTQRPTSHVDGSQRIIAPGKDEYMRYSEPLYGNSAPKKITVSNKVCDIYGQIHDSASKKTQDYDRVRYPNQDNVVNSQQYGQIRQTGMIYGQLRRSPQIYNQPNFVRGTRLTASANDMYRRYPVENARVFDSRYAMEPRYVNVNEKNMEVPQRPLPPVPERRDSRAISVRKIIRGYVPVSDNESGSEAGEIQRILQSGSKQKRLNLAEEEWNSDGKSGRASGNESGGGRSENEGEIKSGRSRSARREDPRRHTLSGDQHYSMAGQGGPLSRTMDLEGQFVRGYPPSSNAMLFDDDPGIMSEVETSSTGFRRGGKQRSSLPVVRTPSKTLERPLGLVFLQYRNETKRALLPNEITSIDTVKALFVRSFPKQLSMEYLDSPLVKIYIHDSSKDMFYELEDVRSHLREIRDRSVLRLFESTDVSGGLPMGGVGIPGGVGHFEDPSYFSEPEFDSEYQHQHIHKSKGSSGKGAPYYMGSTTSLPRTGPILRPYSPAVGTLPPDRLKSLPAGNGYMSSPERGSRGYEDPYYSQYTSRSGSITPVIDEEVSDTELLDEQYSLYGVKINANTPRGVRTQFPGPTPAPYDTTRLRVEHMERQLANLTGLVQKALTQTPTPRDFLAPPGRDVYRSDKSVSFEKSVSFSDEPPDMNSPKQHSPQHAADTKPPKPAIKSSTLPRTSSQEKDRLKPAPPPKPASLSPGQYDGRHIYRDLQLTPEMYNQLRGLQKKAKDLRAEVRNLRRMSQAQAHSVKETIRDTFIKIRAMLIAGGEQVWQAGMDQERVRLSRDEDLYKQEMIRLEKDLTDLEASVEELRGNVINRKTRVNMSDVENMALVLSKSSKTVADLKLRFPGLQDSMKAFLTSEMDKVVREEKFLKEEPERLESALRRCKKLTGTLVTLKRLASVQEQRLPCSTGAADGRISPSITETPPITPTSGQHSKSSSGARMGAVSFGGDNSNASDSSQRPENALDALLDELQTFSKPHSSNAQASYSDSTPSDPPAIPIKGIPPSHSAHFSHPHMSEIGRKGSMDSAVILPTQNLTVTTATGSLRRLHSYPSGSDTDNSPPIQPMKSQTDNKSYNKPPIPERNAELFQHISGRRVPPPPPPRTSSKSPLASPTSPSLPPRSPATGLQHIQNVQNMTDKPQSQFEAATQNLGLSTLRRNVPNRSSNKDNKSQTLPRNIGSNLQIHAQPTSGNELQNVSSSSCESVNSQDGTKKGSRKEELEQRHQELLKKQKALQEQYARLQQLQRGNNTLAVVPPAPDQLLKKTGSESNLLQKMGLQMTTTQMTGSLTHLPSTTTCISSNTSTSTTQSVTFASDVNATDTNSNTTTSKVYETDIL
ncbi:hypothetical protein FQR65_LT02642 [Abscondita terminalis]|nr:hypothetical protein FQR65_LT02642 [Abscondita terminalis]